VLGVEAPEAKVVRRWLCTSIPPWANAVAAIGAEEDVEMTMSMVTGMVALPPGPARRRVDETAVRSSLVSALSECCDRWRRCATQPLSNGTWRAPH
jgi:hypothetical protein